MERPDPAASARRAPRRGGAASTDGRLIYAIGDVHGCYDLLLRLLADVAADAAAGQDGCGATLIFCGDYVDRGPDSAKVLEALCQLRSALRDGVLLLKGNHEQALLQCLDEPAFAATWTRFGAAATFRSYGVEAPAADASPAAFETARDQLLANMPALHLRTLQTLDLMLIAGDYAFVHAGVAPGAALDRQVEQDLLWIDTEFLAPGQAFEKIIVHGHSWIDEHPVLLANRLGVDTGAYRTGVLSALRIEGGEVKVLQARDPAARGTAATPARFPLIREPASYAHGAGALHLGFSERPATEDDDESFPRVPPPEYPL
jgi:serine/threonine protein phosphatase 1